MPTIHGYPVNDGINCYNPAHVGIPTERPSERANQSPVIIKDFPGVFVRPPFQSSPPAPGEEEPKHPICAPRNRRRGVTRTPSGEMTIHGRSASDASGCDIQSNADDSSINYQGNTGEAIGTNNENGEGTMFIGQTDIAAEPFEVAENPLDLSGWALSSDTPNDISFDQLT